MTADDEVRLIQICEQAVKLQMMMRSMKEVYTCEGVIKGEVDSVHDLAEQMGVQGGTTKDTGDQVAYVLFGGLTMRDLLGRTKVLEKAHVIMQRQLK